MTDNFCLHALQKLTPVTRQEFFNIYQRYGSWQEAWDDNSSKVSFNIEAEVERLEKLGIRLLAYTDPDYPQLLREIPDFPLLLYYRGNLPKLDAATLGVVGTRRITTYGRSVTSNLVPPIARSGLIIISGLAYGVDALAHQLTLDAGGITLAVLGSGVDETSIYPRDHTFLAAKIIGQGGALLSEYPPGTPALRHHFLARNRIIAGLTLGTLVTECAQKSGALITARYALDYNRAVYGVPGPIYSPMSEGPNWLLSQGARAITKAADILEDLNFSVPETLSNTSTFSPNELRVLKCMHLAPQSIDSIIAQSQLSTSAVTTALTMLEMNGAIKHLGNSIYQKLS
jgi:DNA processing protein